QQFGGTHHKARRAITALHTATLNQSRLHRMQLFALRQTFNGGYIAARGTLSRHQTGHHGHAVEKDGTSATFTLSASLFHPDKASRSQAVKQRAIWDEFDR